MFKKSSSALFTFRLTQLLKKMKSELDEHRYYLERNVARRTEELTRRIELLEACNASLCSKLASSQLLERQHTEKPKNSEHENMSAKVYLVSTQTDPAKKQMSAG